MLNSLGKSALLRRLGSPSLPALKGGWNTKKIAARANVTPPPYNIQDNPIIRANKQIFREEDYLATQQSEERANWAASVR
ncbi:hypothetical protein DUNSADRAFT_1908 [Dunaliella salina]|uniref:Encoded protein n=1 Tax=Dunaliella salina TaxID=3046 RepID=A0ABQ7GWH9_DUNSA|nr:hypothetical protein DUNSADRAFT_1908 [Dunaliella salina]|eukprot:KAF5838963.1 hypothetical protein DUNSADRAFT_1908 [Dunaliella salina]